MNNIQRHLKQNITIFIEENALWNVVSKISILFRFRIAIQQYIAMSLCSYMASVTASFEIKVDFGNLHVTEKSAGRRYDHDHTSHVRAINVKVRAIKLYIYI